MDNILVVLLIMACGNAYLAVRIIDRAAQRKVAREVTAALVTDPDELGRIAYNAYCASTGGKSLATGDMLPSWDDQNGAIRAAWRRAASAAVCAVSHGRSSDGT